MIILENGITMNDNCIASNLRYLRQISGLKQRQLLDVFHIKRSTWSNYERGLTTPSIADLVAFCKYFKITLDQLILHDLRGEYHTLTKKQTKKQCN